MELEIAENRQQELPDMTSLKATGTQFEQMMSTAISVALQNQESVMMQLRELQRNEDLRMQREEVLETVLSNIKSKTGKRERNIAVSHHFGQRSLTNM